MSTDVSSYPQKIYIQDIFRAEETPTKYVYKLFGHNIKNVAIHGVITDVFSIIDSVVNFELTDPTGSIQVYFDSKKANDRIKDATLKSICQEFDTLLLTGHSSLPILKTMKDAVVKKTEDQANLKLGSYVNVIGDIFVESLKGLRMISAYECNETSAEREIVWLKELFHLYEKYYLWKTE